MPGGRPLTAAPRTTESTGARDPASRRAIFSWCLYDWANSAFPTVIGTFIFSTYFTQAIAATPETGTAQWGRALGTAGILVALAAPVFGAIADRGGRRKPWLAAFTLLSVVATACLWSATPGPERLLPTLAFVVVAAVGFEIGTVFYNAMLPDIADPTRIGRISGWGWGLGYLGGLACMILSLVGFVQTDDPWFGVGTEDAANVRATVLLVAAWYAVFALPLFLFTPDRSATGVPLGRAVHEGLKTLLATARRARNFAGIARFLIARMIYTDGLNTMFAFGGIYAAGTFGMTLAEVIRFGIALNISSALGAWVFAWADDRIGAKRVIVIALVALILLGSGMLIVQSKTVFWFLGLGLGIFLGPAQAASRSMMARLAPEDMRAEMFGLYALSGKAISFLGPFVLGWATLAFDSQRAGMATIVVFFTVGLILLLPVKEPGR